MRRRVTAFLAATFTAPGALAQCQPGWLGGFEHGGFNSRVRALEWLDLDGPGPKPAELYAGGDFYLASGLPAKGLVRWDGWQWNQLEVPLPFGGGSAVGDVTVFDEDGEGPLPAALFVGGQQLSVQNTNSDVVRWDGATWTPVGANRLVGLVRDLTVFDEDGPGPKLPALFAAGDFFADGGIRYLARLDGAAWSKLGAGVQGNIVRCLEVIDEDGDGPQRAALWVGAQQTTFGDLPGVGIGRWDGQAWTDVGTGATGGYQFVADILQFDEDGPGPGAPKVYIGGGFSAVDGQPAARVAAWDGSAWSGVGSNLAGSYARTMIAFDPDGDGPAAESIHVFGPISVKEGGQQGAYWNGAEWIAVPGLNDAALTATMLETERGNELLLGGQFQVAGPALVNFIATWDGGTWRPLNRGVADGYIKSLHSMVIEDGEPPLLFVGGQSMQIEGDTNTALRGWGSQGWSDRPPEPPVDNIAALAGFDRDGPGLERTSLIVGGSFGSIEPLHSPNIAGWNSDGWFAIGADLAVVALAALDLDGGGPGLTVLCAGGSFHSIGGVAAERVALWDGADWQALGTGVNSPALAFAAFDADGDGPGAVMLYAAGDFTKAGGLNVSRIARWDGASWSALPGGGFDKAVTALAACDPDGPAGPAAPVLVAGGKFTTAGGKAAAGLAVWDGAAWKAMDGITATSVSALLAGDPAAGWDTPVLVASGGLKLADEGSTRRLARWDGLAWLPLAADGSDVGDAQASASCLAWHDADGDGPMPPALHIGGRFGNSGSTSAASIARYGCPEPPPCGPDLDGSGTLDIFDFLAFVNLFNAGNFGADFNGDGALDIFDFLAFVNAFNAGC
jgi:hypothetical protein